VISASASVARSSHASVPTTPNDNPFFIFGCPRSGTSLLSRMLGAHSNLAIPYESHLYNNVYPAVLRHADLALATTRARLVTEILRTEHIQMWAPPPRSADVLSAITRYDFHGIVEGLLSSWAAAEGKPRWGEKTPQHTLCWRRILPAFPGAQVINVVRDGRDVALSYKRAFFGPKHVYPLAERWKQYLESAEEARAFLGEEAYLQVRYEDLLASPEQELRRICSFLKEDFDPAMLTYYESQPVGRREPRNACNLCLPVISSNVSKWRTEMSRRELRIFEALAGSALEQYGYTRALGQARVSPLESLACQYLEHPTCRAPAILANRQGQRLVMQKLRLNVCLLLEHMR
jgi:hypothetical protein